MKKILLAALAAFSITACEEIVYVDSETGKPILTAAPIVPEEFNRIYCNGGIVYGMEYVSSGGFAIPIIKGTYGNPAKPDYLTCDMKTGKIL